MEIIVWVYIKEFPAHMEIPYPPAISNRIEECSERNISKVDIGIIDDEWSDYTVNINYMKMFCKSAGRNHVIERHTLSMDSVLGNNIFWEFDAGSRHKSWESFSLKAMEKLEAEYVRRRGYTSTFTLPLSTNVIYDIDLKGMTQTRILTKSKRSIRRTTLTDHYTQICPSETQAANKKSKLQQFGSSVTNFFRGASSTQEGSPPMSKRVVANASGGRTKVARDSDRSPVGSRSSAQPRQHMKLDRKVSKRERLPKEKRFTNCLKTKAQSMESLLKKHVVHVDVASGHESSDGDNTENSHSDLDSDLDSEEDDRLEEAMQVEGATASYSPTYGKHGMAPNRSNVRERRDVAEDRFHRVEECREKSKGKAHGKYSRLKKKKNTEGEEENKTCCICMDLLTQASVYGEDEDSEDSCAVVGLKCKHCFHYLCLLEMCRSQTKDLSIQCPWCKQIYGEKTGICPPGEMSWLILPNTHLAGHEDVDTICITYDIQSGTQGPEHPQPGTPFRVQGFPRICYIPNSNQGRKVLKLLITAWRRRLTFTVGQSVTTGRSGVVTWNEIHHKTEANGNKSGHGYPDDAYLDNVKEELAAHGVSEPDKDL